MPFKTKEEILKASSQKVGGTNLKLRVFPFTVSIAAGEGAYSSPRENMHPWEDYRTVEVAIYAPCGNSDNLSMLGHNDIFGLFGEDVAQLCEGWGFDGFGADEGTVMPYITWDQVVMVVNAIEKHQQENWEEV